MEYRDETCKNLMILTLRITDTSYLMYEVSLHYSRLFLLSNSTTSVKCPVDTILRTHRFLQDRRQHMNVQGY